MDQGWGRVGYHRGAAAADSLSDDNAAKAIDGGVDGNAHSATFDGGDATESMVAFLRGGNTLESDPARRKWTPRMVGQLSRRTASRTTASTRESIWPWRMRAIERFCRERCAGVRGLVAAHSAGRRSSQQFPLQLDALHGFFIQQPTRLQVGCTVEAACKEGRAVWAVRVTTWIVPGLRMAIEHKNQGLIFKGIYVECT